MKDKKFNKYTCYQCKDFIGCPDRAIFLHGIDYNQDMREVGCFEFNKLEFKEYGDLCYLTFNDKIIAAYMENRKKDNKLCVYYGYENYLQIPQYVAYFD